MSAFGGDPIEAADWVRAWALAVLMTGFGVVFRHCVSGLDTRKCTDGRRLMPKRFKLALSLAFVAGMAAPASPASLKSKLDMSVPHLMQETETQGLAVAIIENGRVRHVQAWGSRNAQGDPLTTSIVMYGASLTKAIFAYTVMQLVEEGRIDLDASIADYLAKPLPDYPEEDKYSS